MTSENALKMLKKMKVKEELKNSLKIYYIELPLCVIKACIVSSAIVLYLYIFSLLCDFNKIAGIILFTLTTLGLCAIIETVWQLER